MNMFFFLSMRFLSADLVGFAAYGQVYFYTKREKS